MGRRADVQELRGVGHAGARAPFRNARAGEARQRPRIRPLFIGHEFGNYADRKRRDDVRYILTYTDPRLGYEGSQILDVLEAYRASHVLMTFDVAETPSGRDRAALIDKFGSVGFSTAREPGRARD